MQLRDLLIIAALLGSTVAISVLAMVTGSEVYLFLPGRHGGGVATPPGHPATFMIALAMIVGIHFLSARYAAFGLAGVTAGAYLGLGVGIGAFEWTPGFCQYLLMISLTLTTMFVWSCEDLHSD